MLGSPLYMSPEQMRASRDVDARTDIWSIGIILYELLAGKVPFEGAALPDICVRVATQQVPPLNTHRSDIPLELEAIINKCLEKDRSGRYANIAELAMALAPFGPRRSRDAAERISRVLHEAGLSGTAMTFPPSSQQPSQKPATDTIGGLGYTSPGSKRRRLVKMSIAIGLIAAAAAAGAVTFLRRVTSVTASGLVASPAANAIPQLENSISAAVSAVPITQGPEPNATSPSPQTTSNPSITAGAIAQVKAVASSTSRVQASRAPISKAAVPGTKLPPSSATGAARISQPAAQADARPVVSNGRSAMPRTTPLNNLGGRL